MSTTDTTGVATAPAPRGATTRAALLMCVAVLLPSALVMTTGLAELAFNFMGSPGGIGQAIGQAILALLLWFVVAMTWLVGLLVLMFRRVSLARWLMALTLLGVAGIAVEYAVIDHQKYVLHQPISGPMRPDYRSPHVPNELLAIVDVGLALLLVSPMVGRDFRRQATEPPTDPPRATEPPDAG